MVKIVTVGREFGSGGREIGKRLADAMGIDKFFYTGHSHGAGIGWHLCMNHPERLRGFFAPAQSAARCG